MNTRIAMLAVVVALVPLPANAYLNYIDEAPPAAEPSPESPSTPPISPVAVPAAAPLPVPACSAELMEQGERGKVKVVKTSGKKMGIRSAVEKVAPSDWIVSGKNLSSDRQVSWSRKDTWINTLDMLAKVAGVCVTVDWGAKRIDVADSHTGAQTIPTMAAPAQTAIAPPPETSIASPPPPSNTWVLEEGKTLHENLRTWADRAGWRLVWAVKGTEYMVTHTTPVHGDFLTAINEVMEAYQEAASPIGGVVYRQNQVLKIVDHTNFENNTVSH